MGYKMINCALWVVLILTAFTKTASTTITNENIRDAIISVVHMIRSTDDKLARHETRERALGESLKKTLATIEKRQRLMEPVKGAVGRLDERLAAVETILLQKDERERIQSQRVLDGVDQLQRDMPILMEKIKNDIFLEISKLSTSVQPVPAVETPTTDLLIQNSINEQLGGLTKAVNSLEKQFEKIAAENLELKSANEQTTRKLDDITKQLNTTEDLLLRFTNMIQVIPNQSQNTNDLQTAFIKTLETQKSIINQIQSDVHAISEKIQKLPDSTEIESSKNETLEVLQDIKYETMRSADKAATIIDAKYQQAAADAEKRHSDVEKSMITLSGIMEMQGANTADSYEKLKNDIQSLRKVENVMMQTADNVMDVKRLVEYSVHQILLEVAELIKSSFKNTSASINERFDDFELSILDSENGALANVSSKIGKDIDQVWRQIGIMYQQLTMSTDSLNKLQNQTDAYVNGSLTSMDSMKGKVGKITERMSEVDENLNYLLGRLSLVTQEFNRIKTGLGQALDDIKSSFTTVQEKIRGPGPHKVPDEEYEIQTLDDNTLNGNKTSKRDTST